MVGARRPVGRSRAGADGGGGGGVAGSSSPSSSSSRPNPTRALFFFFLMTALVEATLASLISCAAVSMGSPIRFGTVEGVVESLLETRKLNPETPGVLDSSSGTAAACVGDMKEKAEGALSLGCSRKENPSFGLSLDVGKGDCTPGCARFRPPNKPSSCSVPFPESVDELPRNVKPLLSFSASAPNPSVSMVSDAKSNVFGNSAVKVITSSGWRKADVGLTRTSRESSKTVSNHKNSFFITVVTVFEKSQDE